MSCSIDCIYLPDGFSRGCSSLSCRHGDHSFIQVQTCRKEQPSTGQRWLDGWRQRCQVFGRWLAGRLQLNHASSCYIRSCRNKLRLTSLLMGPRRLWAGSVARPSLRRIFGFSSASGLVGLLRPSSAVELRSGVSFCCVSRTVTILGSVPGASVGSRGWNGSSPKKRKNNSITSFKWLFYTNQDFITVGWLVGSDLPSRVPLEQDYH